MAMAGLRGGKIRLHLPALPFPPERRYDRVEKERAVRVVLLVSWLCLLAAALWAVAPNDPVFPDVPALYGTPVDAKVLKTAEQDGLVIEEVAFHVQMDGDTRVDSFGYFVYPKGAAQRPAVIWNQSGLAPADTSLAVYGAKRGYAMFCFDYPNLGGGYRTTAHYPINSTLVLTDDVRTAPIAHGAVTALKAVSFLRTRPEVDPERIGMCGNSWGGFFSTLMAGVDPRLAACASSFGTGNLQLGCAWWRGAPEPTTAARWAQTLDPGWRLAYAKTPMLWVASTNDTFYWLPALMATYAQAAGPKHLSIMPNWDHESPGSVGQQFDWLDSYLQGKTPLLSVSDITVEKQGKHVYATWRVSGPPERTVTGAELALSYGEPGNWRCRAWRLLPATIQGQTCRAVLPASPLPYAIYGSTFDNGRHRNSTPLLFVDPKAYGLLDPQAALPIDGCAEWGGFEPAQLAFTRNQGFPTPQAATPGKEGAQAALLPAGQTSAFMRPYCIAGLPHRLSGWVRADTPTTVTLRLTGQFDRSQRVAEEVIPVTTEWTPFTLDLPTKNGLWTDLQLTAVVPAGAPVWLDGVRLVPVKP